MLSPQQLPYVLAGVVLMTVSPLFVRLSQNSMGKLDYNPVTSTMTTEALKILISAASLVAAKQTSSVKFDMKDSVKYAIPALIYFLNNNLVFVILQYVNVTTFQLLGQLKTVFTGLLFRVFLGRKLTMVQYLAIWQLAAGAATSHIPLCVTDDVGQESSLMGLFLAVLSCVFSSMAGIYNEKLLKDNAADSIHWQNIQLYTWGVGFNLLGVLGTNASEPHNGSAVQEDGIFSGFGFWAWAVVFANAFNGLAISAILKYADNMARVYAHAVAMIVTMVLSVVLFDESPSAQLIIAVCIVGASTVQYNLKLETIPQSYQVVAPTKSSDEELSVQYGTKHTEP